MLTKRCGRCGETKPVEAFSRCSQSGRQRTCRECQREVSRAWRETNRDHAARYIRERYAANREWWAEWARARYPAIREQRLASNRAWRKANPEQSAELGRRREARKRAALVPGADFSAAQLDARMSMFGHRCWMCGGDFEHVDHIKPLSKGGLHILANLRPACAECNWRKKDRWPLVGIADNRRRLCETALT